MTRQPCKLTEPLVNALLYAQPGEAPQYIVMDTMQKGFAVKVGRDRKTFIAKASVNSVTREVAIGRPEDGMSVADARQRAALQIAAWRTGSDVQPAKVVDPTTDTLRASLATYLALPGTKGGRKITRKQSTVDRYTDILNRHTPIDWWERSVASLTWKEINDVHTKIGDNNGKATANQWARCLRAVYEAHDRRNPELNMPKNPVKAVAFYRVEARRDVVTSKGLKDWWTAVENRSPIRRDCWKMLVLTGLRSNACSGLRWEEIDLDEATLTVPAERMKAGRDFVVPLSRYVVALLKKRKADNERDFGGSDHGFVFPTSDRDGTVRAIRNISEQSYNAKGEKIRLLPGPQVLRRTFNTVATDLGIPEAHRLTLVDHTLPYQGVNGKHYYGQMGDDPIRTSLERVTKQVLDYAGVEYAAETTSATDAQQQAEALVKALGADVIAKIAAMMQTAKSA